MTRISLADPAVDDFDSRNQAPAFQRFLKIHERKLKNIVQATRGEFQLEDLHGEAWLMAFEIRRLRGIRVDFLDPQFLDLLLAHLYKHCVDFREQKIRHALRLDRPRGEADGDDLPPGSSHCRLPNSAIPCWS